MTHSFRHPPGSAAAPGAPGRRFGWPEMAAFPATLVTPALLMLLVSYLILCREHHRWNLLHVVVHENGKNTLLETVFYFRHFMRELPPALLMGVFTAGAFLIGAPDPFLTRRDAVTPLRVRLDILVLVLLAIILLELAIGVGVAIHEEGWAGLKLDVLQYRTRDDQQTFGSHWQYHLLHMADSLVFPVAVVRILRGLTGQVSREQYLKGCWMLGLGGVLFLLLTMVFGGGRDAFTNPLHLAHQFREIATHRILTLLPALGFLFALERQLLTDCDSFHCNIPGWFWQGLGLMALATLIPLAIAWALRHRDLVSMAQKKTSLWVLFASHNFEHLLDAFLVMALSGTLYLLALRAGAAPDKRN